MAKNGKVIITCAVTGSIHTPTMSPHLPLAILVAEDQRFFQHAGFDFDEIASALAERIEGRRLRGASTVSQQVAKNLFLWPGRSLARKTLEAWFTSWLEWLWPKRRILEVHLNVAQFGPCVFGSQAASFRYFGTDAASLSASEAALLAAVLPNPSQISAHDPGPYARQRQQEILDSMASNIDRIRFIREIYTRIKNTIKLILERRLLIRWQ